MSDNSTWTITSDTYVPDPVPPWPLTPTAMLPSIRKASPPNIFLSATPVSALTSSRTRVARSSS